MKFNNKVNSIKELLQGLKNDTPEAKQILLGLTYYKIKEITELNRNKHADFFNNTVLMMESVTDLSHDVYVKLLQTSSEIPVKTTNEFYRYLSTMVINHLRDNFKKHLQTQKRHVTKVPLFNTEKNNGNYLVNGITTLEEQLNEFINLEKQLDKLEKKYPRQTYTIKLKYFLGLSYKEIARLNGYSIRTIENDIKFAKSWLKVALI